jgi:hypothetical protein
MPKDVEHYFTTASYPRTEIDIFEPDTPQIKSTAYLTSTYALSSINHASMWNQRRPLIAYWGTKASPKYLQVRLLHDNYDFSSASITTAQQENKVIAAINFVTGLGDKHISIDKVKDGKFIASDIRLRFEFGNTSFSNNFITPALLNTPVVIETDYLKFTIQLLEAEFNNQKVYWEKGTDGKNSWIDVVLYKGIATQMDLLSINKAITAFTLAIDKTTDKQVVTPANFQHQNNQISIQWEGLSITANTNILPVEKHKGWF